MRTICAECKEPYVPDSDIIDKVIGHRTDAYPRDVNFFKGAGCSKCRGTGFRGRVGLFEFVLIDDSVREAIIHRASRQELRQIAESQSYGTLRQDGWSKIRDGITTIEEVLRVTEVS